MNFWIFFFQLKYTNVMCVEVIAVYVQMHRYLGIADGVKVQNDVTFQAPALQLIGIIRHAQTRRFQA